MPKVSVIMAAYNAEKYLEEAIDSVLNQTFSDFEFIVVDDASKDRTADIIKNYNDKRIVYIRNETNLKLPASLNKAIKVAKGEYIARMDADDICLPKRFEKQVKFLDNNPNIGVVGCAIERFNNSKILSKEFFHNGESLKYCFLTGKTMVNHPSVMIRNSIFEELNIYYDEGFEYGQDFKLWNDLKYFTEFANLDDVLLKYRTLGTKSLSKINLQNKNRFKVVSSEYKRLFNKDINHNYESIINYEKLDFSTEILKKYLVDVKLVKDRRFKYLLVKRFLRSKMKSKYDIIGFILNLKPFMLLQIIKG